MPGDLISIEEARARVLATARMLAPESVPAAGALGRVLAEDVVADIELPPFASSAMDGFALVAAGAGELEVVGESQAGAPFHGRLERGQAVRISTGAVIPDGADAVVPIERVDERDRRIRVPETAAGAHIRRAGEDVRPAQLVLAAGTEIGPAELGMLAALGRVDASVARRPRVALAATGDELRDPGEPLEPGQIYDSNAAAIGGLVAQAGGDVVRRTRIADDAALTVQMLGDALEDADVICIAGGVSVGPHDHVRPAMAELGFDQRVWGVRLKPGKPFWFGVRDHKGERQYGFGLPGNPVSAMVTFTLFARPLLRALEGADPEATRSTALLDGPVAANPDRDQAIRCRLSVRDDGFHVDPTGPQGSHVISSMLGARALAIVEASDRDLAPGERVPIELL